MQDPHNKESERMQRERERKGGGGGAQWVSERRGRKTEAQK